MKRLTLIPPAALTGSVGLPGSKSITNRALLIAALANGVSTITGALKSDDTKYMASALRSLGVQITEPDETSFVVHGTGGHLEQPDQPLYLGNAGTAVRFLTAAACLVVGQVEITGDARMQARPIQPLTDALSQLSVQLTTTEGCPPVHIVSTGKLTGFFVEIDGSVSSQYISALLMVLPYTADRETELRIRGQYKSQGYIEITTSVMSAFGVTPLSGADGRWILPHQHYRATDFVVEPDASSATYFWAAQQLLGQPITIANAPRAWNQPDAAAKEIMEQFPRPFGLVDGSNIQDAVPTLAVLAAFADGQTRFTGIKNLRVKECDRIVALVTELNKIKPGLAHEEGHDLVIDGDKNLAKTGRPAEIATYHDHRIAMAFAVAGLRVPGLVILDPDCVDKSFPGFWVAWRGLGVTVS